MKPFLARNKLAFNFYDADRDGQITIKDIEQIEFSGDIHLNEELKDEYFTMVEYMDKRAKRSTNNMFIDFRRFVKLFDYKPKILKVLEHNIL